MASMHENLARPLDPAASAHIVPPSPRYCLYIAPRGMAWMVPYIYKWGFQQYLYTWYREHGLHGAPQKKDLPSYVQIVEIDRLTFESPAMAPPDA
jgi:hypothetical protein